MIKLTTVCCNVTMPSLGITKGYFSVIRKSKHNNLVILNEDGLWIKLDAAYLCIIFPEEVASFE